MNIPPFSESSAAGSSKKTDLTKKTGEKEPKILHLEELASKLNFSSEKRHAITENITREAPVKEQGPLIGDSGIHLPRPIKRRAPMPLPEKDPPSQKAVRGQPKSLKPDESWHEVGLFKQVPKELISLVQRDTVYEMPVKSKGDVRKCISEMKIHWKPPYGTPDNEKIFHDIDIKKFAQWVGLNKIPINGLELEPEDLKNLLPHLEYLNLKGTEFVQYDLLASCKTLQHLNLQWHDLDDEDLKSIETLTKITYIDLRACENFTGEGFKTLEKLPKLDSLSLRDCDELSEADLMGIAKLEGLIRLNLSNCSRLTDANLQGIAELPNLQFLNVRKCNQLTDEGFSYLKEKLPELKLRR